MGVDFLMGIVKPHPGNHFERVAGENAIFVRPISFMNEVFSSFSNERVQSILPKPVSFDWYESRREEQNGTESGPTADNCWEPDPILECLETVCGALRLHDDEFPPFYWLSKKEAKSGSGGARIFHDGKPFYVEGGWGNCIARLSDIPKGPNAQAFEIDLSNRTQCRCRDYVWVKVEGKMEGREGPEIILYINRESYFELHKRYMDEMMAVVKFAKDQDCLLYTHVG